MVKVVSVNQRQVVTFHNQRDFIFVRHHRYIYKSVTDNDLSNADSKKSNIKGKKKEKKEKEIKSKIRARLQELGPRFTLKLKWLQESVFNPEAGEYEWIHKRKEVEGDRRIFYL